MEHLYSHELIEKFNEGEKDFANVVLEFCDLDSKQLESLTIRNAKINYVTFRHCALKGARFINCEMFFVSFYAADLEGVVFENCKIDMTRFDDARMNKTRIANSSISYCLMTNVNLGEVDFQNTSRFKLITNLASVTESDIEDALKIIGHRMEDLPIEIKVEVRKRLSGTFDEAKLNDKLAKISSTEMKPYGGKDTQYNRTANVYSAMDNFITDIIKYGLSEVYKSKKKDIYKE